MPGASTPQTLLEPIAADAGGGFITNPIPDAPTGTNAASIQGGFPQITMTEELAGGEPPLGQDMNGFLFLLSSHIFYLQCGQGYQYNAALVAQIGGYLVGSILAMADGTGTWINTVDGNTTNPDTGGAGWAPLTSYGFTTASGLTGGVVTLTAAQAKYRVVVLAGVLTSNLIVNLPETDQFWLIVNTTTGAFTTKVQTVAALASVIAPQGGFGSPTGVYGVGDGNIYPSVAPLSVPIDQAPTPSTLAERTNTGAILATVFNSSEGATNPTIDNVIVDSGDGNFQKMSLANFLSQALGSDAVQQIRAGNTGAVGVGSHTINFSTPFANACVAVTLTVRGTSATYALTGSPNKNSFTFNSGSATSYDYIAVGN